jgi:hypothetical protein
MLKKLYAPLRPEKDTCINSLSIVYQYGSIDTTLDSPLFSLDSSFNLN